MFSCVCVGALIKPNCLERGPISVIFPTGVMILTTCLGRRSSYRSFLINSGLGPKFWRVRPPLPSAGRSNSLGGSYHSLPSVHLQELARFGRGLLLLRYLYSHKLFICEFFVSLDFFYIARNEIFSIILTNFQDIHFFPCFTLPKMKKLERTGSRVESRRFRLPCRVEKKNTVLRMATPETDTT